jgi:hypothetical protein
MRTMVVSIAPSAGSSGRFTLLRGRFIGGGSCRILLFFGLAGILSSSRYITGTLQIAIRGPFLSLHVFNDFDSLIGGDFLQSGIKNRCIILKIIDLFYRWQWGQ